MSLVDIEKKTVTLIICPAPIQGQILNVNSATLKTSASLYTSSSDLTPSQPKLYYSTLENTLNDLHSIPQTSNQLSQITFDSSGVTINNHKISFFVPSVAQPSAQYNPQASAAQALVILSQQPPRQLFDNLENELARLIPNGKLTGREKIKVEDNLEGAIRVLASSMKDTWWTVKGGGRKKKKAVVAGKKKRTGEKVMVDGKERAVYVGPRGGRYIKKQCMFIRI